MNADPDDLHLIMHENAKRRRGFYARGRLAIKVLFGGDAQYGMNWGDPETLPPLRHIRDEFLVPHVSPNANVVEIGPGGGRWTRYLLGAKKLYVVDAYSELLDELRRNYNQGNMIFVRNNGTDFPGIDDNSIDFIFSFGVFVHLEQAVIRQYLENMKRIIKPSGVIVLQYSDKNKPLARANAGFCDNDPETMRKMADECGYRIVAEDTQTLWHSAVIQLVQKA